MCDKAECCPNGDNLCECTAKGPKGCGGEYKGNKCFPRRQSDGTGRCGTVKAKGHNKLVGKGLKLCCAPCDSKLRPQHYEDLLRWEADKQTYIDQYAERPESSMAAAASLHDPARSWSNSASKSGDKYEMMHDDKSWWMRKPDDNDDKSDGKYYDKYGGTYDYKSGGPYADGNYDDKSGCGAGNDKYDGKSQWSADKSDGKYDDSRMVARIDTLEHIAAEAMDRIVKLEQAAQIDKVRIVQLENFQQVLLEKTARLSPPGLTMIKMMGNDHNDQDDGLTREDGNDQDDGQERKQDDGQERKQDDDQEREQDDDRQDHDPTLCEQIGASSTD